MYSPSDGRFLTRDTWMGDYNRPLSLNRWGYTSANPVNYTDPSGHDPWWCKGRPDERECIAAWVKGQTSQRNNKPEFYWTAYDWEADHSIYLNHQMGACTACHLGKEMDWRESGFIPSNGQYNAFEYKAAQMYYSGAMMAGCSINSTSLAICAGLGLITDTNPITAKPFSSSDEKVVFFVAGTFPALIRAGNLSCLRPSLVGGINPNDLRGAGINEIRRIVPANAIEGVAAYGNDPKWTWIDDLGNTWEIRYHLEANSFFVGKGPSGYGPTIKFGQQVLLAEGKIPIDLLQPIDTQFVQRFGAMGASSHPMTGLYYVDEFGYVYYDDLGQLWPLMTNQTHIPGQNNPWPYIP